MENLPENIVGGLFLLAPTFLIVVKIFAAEYITSLTKKLFQSKTNKKANQIFSVVVGFLFLVGAAFILSPHVSPARPETDPDTPEQQAASHKSKDELIAEGLNKAYDETKDGITDAFKNKKKKDSTIIADRAKRLVYQIGNIKDDEDGVLELFEELKDVSPNISVFKISKNKYLVYEDNQYSETQINDSFPGFESEIKSAGSTTKIVDLMQYCKAKEIIVDTKPLKFRRPKIEIPCCQCDK